MLKKLVIIASLVSVVALNAMENKKQDIEQDIEKYALKLYTNPDIPKDATPYRMKLLGILPTLPNFSFGGNFFITEDSSTYIENIEKKDSKHEIVLRNDHNLVRKFYSPERPWKLKYWKSSTGSEKLCIERLDNQGFSLDVLFFEGYNALVFDRSQLLTSKFADCIIK